MGPNYTAKSAWADRSHAGVMITPGDEIERLDRPTEMVVANITVMRALLAPSTVSTDSV